MRALNANEEVKMSYTVVWNEGKSAGIILSGENANKDAEYATTGKTIPGWYSALASEFYEIYGQDGGCTIQNNVEDIK